MPDISMCEGGSTLSMLGGGHWTQYYNRNFNQNK